MSAKVVEIPTFINPHVFWIFDVQTKGERKCLEISLKHKLTNPVETTPYSEKVT